MVSISVNLTFMVQENLIRINEKNTDICSLKNFKNYFVFI